MSDSSWAQDKVKERFIELSKKFHPDNKITGDASKFIMIRQAYEEVEEYHKYRKRVTRHDDELRQRMDREAESMREWRIQAEKEQEEKRRIKEAKEAAERKKYDDWRAEQRAREERYKIKSNLTEQETRELHARNKLQAELEREHKQKQEKERLDAQGQFDRRDNLEKARKEA